MFKRDVDCLFLLKIPIFSLGHTGEIAEDNTGVSMVHYGMWKESEEKPTTDVKSDPNNDPKVDVKKKKEKPKMVGVLEVVRY